LYGPDVVKPNHHYAIHVGHFVRNHGPLHCFWTFLFERMNKVLKTFKTNNHSGGEIETTFFREFHRSARTSRLLSQASQMPPATRLPLIVSAMYKATADDRGTIHALASELDAAEEYEGVHFELGKKAEVCEMSPQLYALLLQSLRERLPLLKIRSWLQASDDLQELPLRTTATFYDHVIVNQSKLAALSRSNTHAESLIAIQMPNRIWVGELLDIIVFSQEQLGFHRFGHVRWLKPYNGDDISETPWSDCSSLGVTLWRSDSYLGSEEPGPMPLIDLADIIGYAIRLKLTIDETDIWGTITIPFMD
ncbi:hypothetical protein K474DRAFT_1680242, partial [Panus rudis PR-1116 ss-1]